MNLQMTEDTSMRIFDELESEVRSYCRSFNAVFNKARNEMLWDVTGKAYIDFFAGAGALNYGHNNPAIKERLIDYLRNDGVTHSLDMATWAKERFLKRFSDVVLEPRAMSYKIMFPGPTGTNSVESALKIARKVTGRTSIICFTGAFHGMTVGSLSVTGNRKKRQGAGISLAHSVFMPYDGYFDENFDSADYMEKMLADGGSGVELPAAVILETVQGEGGLQTASFDWLRRIESICRRFGILLIIDDVQMGCGRTGSFFSFEAAGVKPDIVCLSKSIGGYGLPLALTLIKPELDIWSPGEHNGTFRGNNLGFVAATAALDYWVDGKFESEIERKAGILQRSLGAMVRHYPGASGQLRGRGLIQGISFAEKGFAEKVCSIAFENGLIMETSGPESEAIKMLPPLTIGEAKLEEGLRIVESAIRQALEGKGK